MDLLENAVQAIELGVDDYCSGTHARLLSAVRNIHAGILLLYKEALRRLSPSGTNDVLMKAKVVPRQDADGNVSFVGEGKKTAGIQQIRKWFEKLGIATDWARFKRINEARNDVEHYYPQLSQKALEGVIADSFVLVRNFIATELEENPQELLNDKIWKLMLEITEVHHAEKAECSKLLECLEWQSEALSRGVLTLKCANCGSDLLKPDLLSSKFSYETDLQCRCCGETENAEFFVPRAIEEALSWDMYLSATDGNETPYVSCPECGQGSYVIDERRCALCEHEAEHDCAVCGNPIPPEELDSSPFCGWCAHMAAKDD